MPHDLDWFQSLLVAGNLSVPAAIYLLWKIDRRILQLEIKVGYMFYRKNKPESDSED